MGSSKQQDRSLGSGISLPQWMKGKMDNRFDLDESAFSPPSYDDSFFYLRYPKSNKNSSATPNLRQIDNAATNENTVTASNQSKPTELVSDVKKSKEVDFSKHPLPCQPFVPTAANKGNEIRVPKTVIAGKIKPKSQGTDDGFHGEPALCGKSIVHVANQMMSSKLSHSSSQNDTANGQPKKGSKSLPATPLASPMTSPDSSPKARRRVHTNRYFTGAFIPDREKYQGGWILANILGQSREIVTLKIDEEDESAAEIAPPKNLNRKKSISSQNLTYIGGDEKSGSKSPVNIHVFQAKPSELREMNFWSPTSM
ncbi:uncharacterized protein [Prorops nasuta]|uniref:uncharacterized protein n=1 Tax=Prorops nasuta TaxID=863751 RepID=UPI0034CE9C5E